MIGNTLAHYTIVEKIGAGGMGEVYRAEDTRLKRQVALKVLPPEMAANPERLARFQREAEAVAALDHPSIVTIYSIDESDGTRFLTMELIQGQTLDRVIPEGGMSVADLFDVSIPLTDALAAAHLQGITHRDVKPANVMITDDDRVKVLDFGLAKLGDPSLVNGEETVEATHLRTREDVLLGTASYMSPEQAEGRAVDARSDVFSLGIVLFEMATGRRPFQGDSAMRVLSSILRDPVPRASESRPDLPAGLDGLLGRCLDKDPDARFASARELRDALQQLRSSTVLTHGAGAAEATADRSIAVLAFANMSADPENEFFSDGVSEEIINSLTRVPGLRVAGRTSAFSFKGKNTDLRTIGRRLGVDTVLEGSVRKAGDRLRIAAQLVNVEDGYHLWSERYDRKLDDVFEIQDEIAVAIATRLERTLMDASERRAAPARTDDVEAYELCVKGRALIYQRGLAITKGMECLRQALTRDPDYALAHAWLATAHVLVGHYGMASPHEEFAKARAAATRALELDPDQPDAHCAVAAIAVCHDWNWDEARRYFQRALKLDAGNTQARVWYSLWWLWGIAGRPEDSLSEGRRARELDPLSAYAASSHAWALSAAGRHEEAVEASREAMELDPESVVALWAHAHTCLWSGRRKEAIDVGEQGLRASGRSPWHMMVLAFAYSSAGRKDDARALYDEFRARARREYVQPTCLAGAALASGDRDDALASIARAYEERDALLSLVRAWPDFEPLRQEAAYRRVLERMRLAVS
jgi:serine/threonine-protein kinase